MNDVIASNIRFHRERLSWTQEHLAEAAQLTSRTVQRAEQGRGTSADTLLAIAGALGLSVDELRTDPLEKLGRALGVPRDEVTPDFIAARARELESKYTTIPLVQVKSSADLHRVFDAEAMLFECNAKDDSVLDVAAELKQYFGDLLDVAGDAEPIHQREFEKAAFAIVERLNHLGCAVSVGLHRHGLRLANGETLPWSTIYVIVGPQAEAKAFVAVERNMPVRFA